MRKSTSPRRPRRGKALARPSCRHRQVVPGATLLLTKKTHDDVCWLVPCPLVNAVLLYLLALKAKKYGVLVHAFVFMSNHFHLVITDPGGVFPEFMKEFLSESGKALKIVRRTSRDIWSDERYGDVRLLDLDAAERSIAYLPLNPPEAELTEPDEWPGLTSARLRFGDSLAARRPEFYFSENRPEIVSLTLSPLTCASMELLSTSPDRGEGSEERIRALVERRCAEIRRDLASRGARLAGPQKVMKTPCTKRTSHPLRNLKPRFATKDRALLVHAIAERRQFEIDHEAAKRRFIAGRHRTPFPFGTYGYRVVLGVRIAKPRRAAG